MDAEAYINVSEDEQTREGEEVVNNILCHNIIQSTSYHVYIYIYTSLENNTVYIPYQIYHTRDVYIPYQIYHIRDVYIYHTRYTTSEMYIYTIPDIPYQRCIYTIPDTPHQRCIYIPYQIYHTRDVYKLYQIYHTTRDGPFQGVYLFTFFTVRIQSVNKSSRAWIPT